MDLSLQELAKIYAECNNDIARVADRLGLDVSLLSQSITPPTPIPLQYRQRPENLGRPEMRKYLVSARPATGEWPIADRDIINQSRELYKLGTHEMCQGRDRDWIILYLIPRKQPVQPRKFFREIL